MRRYVWVCHLVLSLALMSSASAQQTLRRFEIGAQTTMLEAMGQTDLCADCLKAHWSVGPAATFNIDQHFAIDGALTFFRARSGNPSGLVGGNLTQAIVGLKASARGSRLSLFASLRPGFVRWSQGQVTNIRYPNGPQAPAVYSYAPRTNLGIQYGGGLEYAVSPRLAFRAEMGSMETVWHRYEGNMWELPYTEGSSTSAHLLTGIFYRFGGLVSLKRPPLEGKHKFLDKTNLALFSAGLLASTADAVTTQRIFGNCRRHSPYPNDTLLGCAQLEKNLLARPFVSHGWGGQIAFTALVNAGEILTSFALHRMGHHRVERLLPAFNAAETAVVAYRNLGKAPVPGQH